MINDLASHKKFLLRVAIVLFGFINIGCGDAVLVTTFSANPRVLMVVKTRLIIEVGVTTIAPPINIGESIAHIYTP